MKAKAKSKAKMPDVIVPPVPEDPTEAAWLKWSDDNPPPVFPQEDYSHLTGFNFWEDMDGKLRVTLHQSGHMTELKPHPDDAGRALGFYDLDLNPIPDPYD